MTDDSIEALRDILNGARAETYRDVSATMWALVAAAKVYWSGFRYRRPIFDKALR